MAIIHPNDFESTEGQKKIIGFLHEMDAKIHRLEHALQLIVDEETELKQEIEEMAKIEAIEEEEITDEKLTQG